MSKIAIIISNRQAEAVRMSSGITFCDDEVELFFLDTLIDNDDEVEMMMEIASEMELPMFSNIAENDSMTQLTTEALHSKLLDYDHIIAY